MTYFAVVPKPETPTQQQPFQAPEPAAAENAATPEEALKTLMSAKSALSKAQAAADAAQEVLIALIDKRTPSEFGSKTYDVGDIKVIVERKNNLSCGKDEQAAMVAAFTEAKIDVALLPFVSKTEINESKYKKLEKDNPEAFKIAAKFATSKPAKVSAKIGM